MIFIIRLLLCIQGNVSFNRTTGDRLGVRTLITQYRTQNENISRSLVAYDVTCSNPDYCRIIFLPNVDSLFPGIPNASIILYMQVLCYIYIIYICMYIQMEYHKMKYHK